MIHDAWNREMLGHDGSSPSTTSTRSRVIARPIAQSVDAVRYYRDDLERSCVYLEKRRRA
jgi:hypothetical protein